VPVTGAFGPTEGAGRGAQRLALDPIDDILVCTSTGMDSNAPGWSGIAPPSAGFD